MASAPSVAVALAVLGIAALGGCGPLVDRAPFAVRPDSIRAGDLLGPYDGIVLDADSDRPVSGATVAASWAFENGIGFHAPSGAREVVVQTGADGRYTIPRLDDLPEGASQRRPPPHGIRPFSLPHMPSGYWAAGAFRPA